MLVTLTPHPDTPSAVVERITVDIGYEGLRLRLKYGVEGDTAKIRWPRSTEHGRANGLWRHTCFEAFISTDDGYREFNFAISGQWASYSFSSYRQDMAPAPEAAERVGLEGRGDYNDSTYVLDLPPSAKRLALSAVVEDIDGNISYWALAHPSAKPDFHHPDSFVLDLP